MKKTTPKIFILFLPLIYFILVGGIYFIKKTNPYFELDPDAAYLANAIAILTGNPIRHIDHPGTLYQIILAIFLSPFSIFSSSKSSFIDFYIKNIYFLYTYLRIVNWFVLFFAVSIFLKALHIISNSKYVVFFGFLVLFSSSFMYQWLLRITPEVMIFFLLSFWLYIVSRYIKGIFSDRAIWLLPIIAGLAMAAKISALPIVISTIIFLIIDDRENNKLLFEKFISTVQIFCVIAVSFLFGTFPIISKYSFFLSWLKKLITHTEVYGGGKNTLFDLNDYIKSLVSLIHRDLFIYLALLVVIIFILKKSKLTNKINKLYFSLFFSLVLCLLIFARYPYSHYQIINYAMIAFLFGISVQYFPNILKKNIRIIAVTCIGIMLFVQMQDLNHIYTLANDKLIFMNKYKNSSMITIWDYLPSEEMALLFGLDFSHFYNSNLKGTYPNLRQMFGNPLEIYDLDEKTYDIKKYCWSEAFFQAKIFPIFMRQYGDNKDLKVIKSPDGSIYFIQRANCQSNPNEKSSQP